MPDEQQKGQRKLLTNVHVLDEETGEGRWHGPDYPAAGDPPEGAVTNPAAFEPRRHDADLRFRADDYAGAEDSPRFVADPEPPSRRAPTSRKPETAKRA